jgi:hypothetical protein
MGRITVLSGENLTLGTGNVLAAWRTAAAAAGAARTKIKRVEISQSGTTTLQQIRGEIATRDAAGTLTMSAATPQNVRPLAGPVSGLTGNTAPVGGDARSGVNSSADSGGTYTSKHPFNFPNTAGYLFKPDPAEEIEVPASTVCCVRLLAAPTTTTGWTVSVWLEEE